VNYEEVLIWTETLLIALAQYFRHGVLFPQSDDHFEVKKARVSFVPGRVWIGPRVDRGRDRSVVKLKRKQVRVAQNKTYPD
jgi:hypothetical protein